MIDKIPDGMFVVGNKLYGECCGCGKIVRINKSIFGSLHICSFSEEESLIVEDPGLENIDLPEH